MTESAAAGSSIDLNADVGAYVFAVHAGNASCMQWDALTSDRPYRKGMDKDKALQIIEEISGTQLCPDCVDIFIKMQLWDGAPVEDGELTLPGSFLQKPLIEIPEPIVVPGRK